MKNQKLAAKRFLLFLTLSLTAGVFSLIKSNAAFAATASGIVTDTNDVRWEYSYDSDKSLLSVRFFDKPANTSTVVVPSLADFISLVPEAPNSLDTYILESADLEAQAENFPSFSRRTATASTTKLDMSNTSKIQIRGVAPIIDPEVETELVFGENMVIGDTFHKNFSGQACYDYYYNSYYDAYSCYSNYLTFENVEDQIDGWDSMSIEEQAAYEVTPEDLGYTSIGNQYEIPAADFDETKNYMRTPKSSTAYEGGAFAGYKLKLTNFESSNFNYVGYEAFKDSTLNNTTITIDGDSLLGGNIFQNTNVTKAIINTEDYGTGIFKDCAQLTEVEFADGITKINDDAFAGTGLTSIDFSNTDITTIGARAFEESKLTSVNFEGVQRINYGAFRYNDIAELYLPKSINYLQSGLFYGNKNLKKVTVAYDTLTSGTTLPFFVVLDSYYAGYSDTNSPTTSIEEINVIAPYGDGEQVSATHVTYDDYRWHYDPNTQEHFEGDDVWIDHAAGSGYGNIDYTHYSREAAVNNYPSNGSYKFEDDYADVDSKKNVIAPIYFLAMHNLKRINIGEGYEYIGSSAFWNMSGRNDFGTWWGNKYNLSDEGEYCYGSRCYSGADSRHLDEVNLPESLVGVGNLAFESNWNPNIKVNLPENLEFIGIAAFRRVWHMNLDFDLPNLKYLGDYAFESTMLKNITLHDKIYYMGEHVFSNIPTIENITIDFDIFNPDLMVVWVDPKKDFDSYGSSYIQTMDISTWTYTYDFDKYEQYFQNYFKRQFGEHYGFMWGDATEEQVAHWGIKRGWNALDHAYHQKFDTITFTEKAVHEIPCLNYELDLNDKDNYTSDVFFGYLDANKVDLSATPWKVLPRNAFMQAKVDTIELPENLEVIGTHAFNSTIIENELVLPDSVKIIGERAFESHRLTDTDNINSATQHSYSLHTAIIKSLPSSLEYVGAEAFYEDDGLEADLNASNLYFIGERAFMSTNVRDVLIPEGVTSLREATFANDPSLRNITIDADFGAIVAADQDNTPNILQSLSNWASNNYSAVHTVKSRKIEACKEEILDNWECTGTNDQTYSTGTDFRTFYSIFNKTMRESTSGTTDGQQLANESFGELSFGKNNTTPIPGSIGIFSWFNFDKVDMSEAGWESISNTMGLFYRSNIGELLLPEGLKSVPDSAFMYTTVDESFELPSTLQTLERASFQWADVDITNALPSSVTTIGGAAFYESDFTDELVIPAGVTSIGWSAFNAGGEDVHYDSVTIKPDLTSAMDQGQLVHQLFWNAEIDELTVESSMLVALEKKNNGTMGGSDQEFYNMPIKKVTLTNLPEITRQAFINNSNLEQVDAGADAALRAIDEEAFLGAEKLHIFNFSPAIKNETVTIGKNAFKTTAFETMGDGTKDFDLTAAKFDGSEGYAFSGMPKLRTVDIPETFSNATVPRASFYDDPELTEATVAYKVTDIKNAAFANDDKLERIFIWGNTIVEDKNIGGYTAPTRAPDDTVGDEFGPTIPEGTDIYAYSANLTEEYAGFEGRDNFEGTFYPLDEVLYLTSNKPRVQFNEDESDFDKSNLVVYGLRRDGVVLQSNSWGEFDGTVYSRNDTNLTFEKMSATIEDDPAFGSVYDTPVPLNELSYANENFDEIDFELVRDAEDENVRLINIIYTDAYTRGQPDTDLDPYAVYPDPEPTPTPQPDDPGETLTWDKILLYCGLFGSFVAVGTVSFLRLRKLVK